VVIDPAVGHVDFRCWPIGVARRESLFLLVALGMPLTFATAHATDYQSERSASAVVQVGPVRVLERSSLDFNLGLGASGLFRLGFMRAGIDAGYLDLPDRIMIRDSVSWDSSGVTVTILGIDRERNRSFFGGVLVRLVWPGPRSAPYALASFGMYDMKYREIEEARTGVSLGLGLQPEKPRSFGGELRWHRIGLKPDGTSLATLMFTFRYW